MNQNNNNSVTTLPGIGSKSSEYLEKMGINTVDDLLHYSISELEARMKVEKRSSLKRFIRKAYEYAKKNRDEENMKSATNAPVKAKKNPERKPVLQDQHGKVKQKNESKGKTTVMSSPVKIEPNLSKNEIPTGALMFQRDRFKAKTKTKVNTLDNDILIKREWSPRKNPIYDTSTTQVQFIQRELPRVSPNSKLKSIAKGSPGQKQPTWQVSVGEENSEGNETIEYAVTRLESTAGSSTKTEATVSVKKQSPKKTKDKPKDVTTRKEYQNDIEKLEDILMEVNYLKKVDFRQALLGYLENLAENRRTTRLNPYRALKLLYYQRKNVKIPYYVTFEDTFKAIVHPQSDDMQMDDAEYKRWIVECPFFAEADKMAREARGANKNIGYAVYFAAFRLDFGGRSTYFRYVGSVGSPNDDTTSKRTVYDRWKEHIAYAHRASMKQHEVYQLVDVMLACCGARNSILMVIGKIEGKSDDKYRKMRELESQLIKKFYCFKPMKSELPISDSDSRTYFHGLNMRR